MPLPAGGNLSDFPSEIPQFYSMRLLRRAVPFLIHGRWGQKRDIPPNSGVNIQFRRIERPSPSTTALVEGSAGAPNQPSVYSINATVVQYGQHSVHSDLQADQSLDQLKAEFTDAWGETMGISIDLVDRAVLVAGSQVQYAGTATSRGTLGSGMRLTTAELSEARRTLRRNDARPVEDDCYVAVISPDGEADLMADPNYITAANQAAPRDFSQNMMFTGRLHDWMGIRPYVTSQAAVVSGAGLSATNVYQTLVFGAEAYAVSELTAEQARIITKMPDEAGSADPLEQRWTIGYKVAHTALITNQAWIVRIEHTSAAVANG